MYYRVDYIIGVMLAGALAGALPKRASARISAHQLARAYLYLVAVLLGVRAVVFVCGTVAPNMPVWNLIAGGISDAGNFMFGALFGVGLSRSDRRELLCDTDVYTALCLSLGLGYVIAGYSKALYMQGMTDFFTQSGYSTAFLKFIMTVEVLGGIGVLIPWTVLPALGGLSIDMFGAIWTHVHNGDPLNDSTGAIANLIKIAVVACLWAWRARLDDRSSSVRRRLAGVGAMAVFCFVFAVVGSHVVRHGRRASAQLQRRMPLLPAHDHFDRSYFGAASLSARRLGADS